MTIDTASREPEPKIDPTEKPVPFDFRPIVWDAVVRSQGQKSGMFKIDDFGVSIQRRFDLNRVLPPADCEKVLSGLDYVTQIPGSGHYWKLQTG